MGECDHVGPEKLAISRNPRCHRRLMMAQSEERRNSALLARACVDASARLQLTRAKDATPRVCGICSTPLRNPGRRVFPNVLPATVPGVDIRASYKAECDAPPIWACYPSIITCSITR
jgi:hypothetical protein